MCAQGRASYMSKEAGALGVAWSEAAIAICIE